MTEGFRCEEASRNEAGPQGKGKGQGRAGATRPSSNGPVCTAGSELERIGSM